MQLSARLWYLHYLGGLIDADLRIGRRENVIGPGRMQGLLFFGLISFLCACRIQIATCL
jgi:hypothetical protein